MPESLSRQNWRVDLLGGCKRYGENVLFRHLDLTLRPGNAIRLVGANGSGKTQLLQALCGLNEMDRGRIVLVSSGKTKTLRSERDRASVFRYVPSHPSVLSSLSVAEFVYAASHALRPLSLRSRARAATAFFERVRDPLEQATGRSLLKDERVCRFSMGEQKRLMLAAALQAQDAPKVILVDEPLAGVDRSGVQCVLQMLREALASNLALLIAEHREEIQSLAFDRVVPMPFSVASAVDAVADDDYVSDDSIIEGPESCVIFRDVHAGYPQQEVAADYMQIASAGVAVLSGVNGAGKTGFLKALAGVQPATLRGSIEFSGQGVKDLSTAEVQGDVRFMSQDRAGFLDLATLDAFKAATPVGVRCDPVLTSMVEWIGRRKYVQHLSSGNRAVLALAQTLSSRPKLALLDEPFANVDAHNRGRLLAMIEHARKAFGTAFLVVEHLDTAVPGASRYTIRQEGAHACIQPSDRS